VEAKIEASVLWIIAIPQQWHRAWCGRANDIRLPCDVNHNPAAPDVRQLVAPTPCLADDS
jgi:hypothetical protein